MRAHAVNGPQSLDPGVFAIVMGTGIVAVDMRNHELPAISRVLVAVAVFAYVLLLVAALPANRLRIAAAWATDVRGRPDTQLGLLPATAVPLDTASPEVAHTATAR